MSDLKVKVGAFSLTSLSMHQTMQHYIPENRKFFELPKNNYSSKSKLKVQAVMWLTDSGTAENKNLELHMRVKQNTWSYYDIIMFSTVKAYKILAGRSEVLGLNWRPGVKPAD